MGVFNGHPGCSVQIPLPDTYVNRGSCSEALPLLMRDLGAGFLGVPLNCSFLEPGCLHITEPCSVPRQACVRL